ncbi:hypothetical protein [Geotalea uraniireducens]|uniref:Metal-dependent hydrolase n=1 Tax=Geotalea uraniireducens (strain Rf4) TaxID=351605 RepID=A5G8N9_GEOUR|nr:hypothetical protein [Geotalea uraniireducens]ABQ28157.1 hypothetical protein Gura_4013 [Geotalea uraniireducens Rf4]
MKLTQHLAVTGIAAAARFPFRSGEQILLFSVGSVLIDVDHYFLYIRRTGRFDVRGMFRYFEELWKIEKDIPYVGLCLFHTFDFFLAVGLLAFHYPVMLSLLAGLLFHFVVDLFDLVRKGVPFIRAYFLLEHLIRRRDKGYPYY